MKKFIITVIVSLIIIGCSSPQKPTEKNKGLNITTDSFSVDNYSASITHPSGTLDFGNTYNINLKLSYPADEKYILLPPEVESGSKYSNTLINSIIENDPQIVGDGMAEATIDFNVEAYLPGKLVFPALTILFSKEIKTEEITLNFTSAFDEQNQEKKLSSIILPQKNSAKRTLIIIVSSVGFILLALVVFFIAKKIHQKEKKETKKSPQELIEDFRKNFIDTKESFDMRTAFLEISKLLPNIENPELKKISEKAKFSKEGVSTKVGKQALYELYQQLVASIKPKEEANK